MNVLIAYLTLINCYCFIIRGIDKRKSLHNQFRISEKNLLITCALGGGLGGIIGSIIRRHKTIKQPFSFYVYGITLMRIIGILGLKS